MEKREKLVLDTYYPGAFMSEYHKFDIASVEEGRKKLLEFKDRCLYYSIYKITFIENDGEFYYSKKSGVKVENGIFGKVYSMENMESLPKETQISVQNTIETGSIPLLSVAGFLEDVEDWDFVLDPENPVWPEK